MSLINPPHPLQNFQNVDPSPAETVRRISEKTTIFYYYKILFGYTVPGCGQTTLLPPKVKNRSIALLMGTRPFTPRILLNPHSTKSDVPFPTLKWHEIHDSKVRLAYTIFAAYPHTVIDKPHKFKTPWQYHIAKTLPKDDRSVLSVKMRSGDSYEFVGTRTE